MAMSQGFMGSYILSSSVPDTRLGVERSRTGHNEPTGIGPTQRWSRVMGHAVSQGVRARQVGEEDGILCGTL